VKTVISFSCRQGFSTISPLPFGLETLAFSEHGHSMHTLSAKNNLIKMYTCIWTCCATPFQSNCKDYYKNTNTPSACSLNRFLFTIIAVALLHLCDMDSCFFVSPLLFSSRKAHLIQVTQTRRFCLIHWAAHANDHFRTERHLASSFHIWS